MLGTSFIRNKKSQQGSIMLEVIAVLALMGVMGAMLFRQIYQRNQELHNIQMASEIRTVKEAFSAYIQAFRADLLGECGDVPLGDLQYCDISNDALSDAISEYLPDGWFSGNEPGDYYTFSLWTYKQSDATEKQIVYGLVVPTEYTLPQTGWNFKRAARVALLIGADAGVYDEEITNGVIAGTLGTWQINVDNDFKEKMGLNRVNNTYIAMTGTDTFTPEYELPDGEVTFLEDMDLGMRDAQAWRYFAAGGSSDCYEIRHTRAVDIGGTSQVQNDTIHRLNETCKPLFYVQNEDGLSKVFVNNDLEIGKDRTTNLTLTQEGRIISSKKVSSKLGDLAQEENFMIDPAYTSTMNDIRLTSRGGVRLSDILPDYILTKVYVGSCTADATTGQCDVSWQLDNATTKTNPTIPSCPTGYKRAATVIPVSTGTIVANKANHQHNIDLDTEEVEPTHTVTVGQAGADNHTHNVTIEDVKHQHPVVGTTGNSNVDFVNTINVDGCTFLVQIDSAGVGGARLDYDNPDDEIKVKMGWSQNSTNFTDCPVGDNDGNDIQYQAILQTYCVWKPSLMTQDECKAAGYVFEGGKCTTKRQEDTSTNEKVMGAEPSRAACEEAGYTWNSTTKRCEYKL